jgi:hypothetical protein
MLPALVKNPFSKTDNMSNKTFYFLVKDDNIKFILKDIDIIIL